MGQLEKKIEHTYTNIDSRTLDSYMERAIALYLAQDFTGIPIGLLEKADTQFREVDLPTKVAVCKALVCEAQNTSRHRRQYAQQCFRAAYYIWNHYIVVASNLLKL